MRSLPRIALDPDTDTSSDDRDPGVATFIYGHYFGRGETIGQRVETWALPIDDFHRGLDGTTLYARS